MPDPIAEAFVRLRPDLDAFEAETQRGVQRALTGVVLPAAGQRRIAGQAFGPAFQVAAATATSNAIAQTRIDDRTFAQKLFGPGFRNESGRAIQGALVGAGSGGGQLAARFAFFGAGGAAIATLSGAAIVAAQSALTLEEALEILRATTQASEDDLDAAAAAAERLGDDLSLPGVTARDATVAILELAKAGLTMQEAIAGAAGTLQLAIAAEVDIGTASQIAAAGLNAFDLAGTEATHVADLLAGAAAAALGDIGDFGLALQQSAAVADQAGLSIEQLVGLITLLAEQGILGSDAGTSIRTALLRLVPTTKEASAEMEKLGINLDETRTLGEQLPDLIEQYRTSLSALTPIQRQAALQQIFGTDAIRAATVVFEEGAQGLDRVTRAADDEGRALELASARAQGASGALADVTSEGEVLALNIGQTMLPAIESLADGLANVISLTNETVEALQRISGFEVPGLDQEVGGAFRDVIEVGSPLIRTFQGMSEASRALAEGDLPGVARGLAEVTLTGAAVSTVADRIFGIGDAAEDSTEDIQQFSDNIASAFTGIAADLRRVSERFQLAGALGLTEEELADLTRTVRREGTAAGVELGRSFIEGTVGAITDEEQEAIDAAANTLARVREEGQAQVQAAIRSARTNVETLAASVGDALAELIDVGPIGQAIDEIDREFERLQEVVQERQLRFDLTEARRDLREARDSIVQVGVLTPEQRRAQREFLDPFKQSTQDARAALREFDLTEQREELDATREAAVRAADEGVEVLVEAFQRGDVSAEEFNRTLRGQLNPALNILRTRAGQNLGIVFTRDFKRDVAALVEQVQSLSGFALGGATAPGPVVVRPAETQQQVNQRIAEAAASLVSIQKDARTLSKEEQGKLDIQINLLRQLVRGLLGAGKQSGVPTRPSGTRGGP